MRISTSQIYNAGALGLQSNQQGLFKLQNQLSSGRRILTPADDPVASAQALVVTQSKDINTQYMENQGSVSAQLGTVEATLGSLVYLVQGARERAVEAKGSLSDNQRGFIATDLKLKFDALLAIANAGDGAGQFLFSGYQGATLPFAIDGSAAPVPPATQPPVTYLVTMGSAWFRLTHLVRWPVICRALMYSCPFAWETVPFRHRLPAIPAAVSIKERALSTAVL